MASEDDFVLVFDESGGVFEGGSRLQINVLIPTLIFSSTYVGISTQMCASALSASHTQQNRPRRPRRLFCSRGYFHTRHIEY